VEDGRPARKGSARPHRDIPWRRYIVLGVIVVVLAVAAFVLITALVPRMWANTVGRQVNGSMSSGIGWGLFYGLAFTLFPLLVAGLAFFRRWKGVAIRVVFLVIAVLLAIPNLLTLAVVVGTSSAAHDAERVLAVNAPFFRGSTAIGAIAGAVIAVVLWILAGVARHRGAELHRLREARKVVEAHEEAEEKAVRKARRAEEKAARARERRGA